MKTALSRIYLVILIMLSILQLRLAHASDLEIQTFRIHVQNFEIAEQDYQRAPSGSQQEAWANQRRQEMAQAAKNIIRAPNTFMGILTQQNEQLMSEFTQRYNAASSGSIRESIYDVARRAAAEGLKINAVADIQNVWDHQQALQLTLAATQKYNAASSGSIVESVWDTVRRQGFVISKQKLAEHIQMNLQDFRQAEALFLQLNQGYNAASSGSLLENYYQEGRRLAQGRTIELMRLNAPYMSLQQLVQIRDEYQSKYNSASSGSLAEQMYRAIRDEAQMRLQSVPPTPVPVPQPVPQPIPGGPTCSIHAGKNAAGQQLFRVLDTAGRIVATTLTVQEAVQISMTDARCR